MMSYHHVSWFDVSVNDALLLGMLDGVADLNEQGQAFFSAEIVFVAVFGDRDTGNQFHYEIRPACFGRSGIEDFSDINLTMSRYTHVLRGQESAAINSLPDLDRLPECQQNKATGTDNKPIETGQNLLPLLLPKSNDFAGFLATNLDNKVMISKNETSLDSATKAMNLGEKLSISEVGKGKYESEAIGSIVPL